jgi:hypothetical protein
MSASKCPRALTAISACVCREERQLHRGSSRDPILLHDPSVAPREISGPRYSERPANAGLSRRIVPVSLNVAADPPFPWAEGLAYSQAIRC